jgi:alpha-galactosidase
VSINRRKNMGLAGYVFCSIMMLGLISSGCAKPPTEEMISAEKAIEEAKRKEADTYAQDIFANASDSLDKARELVSEKKYGEARKIALETTQIAKQAIAVAEFRKKKMKTEIGEMLQDIRATVEQLKQLDAMNQAATGKGRAKWEELEGMLERWQTEITSLEDQIREQNIRAAHDGLKAMKEQVYAEKKKIDSSLSEKTGKR